MPQEQAKSEWPFVIARADGGWRVYDTERREHLGRLWRRQFYAEQALGTLRSHRPPIVRFILSGASGDND